MNRSRSHVFDHPPQPEGELPDPRDVLDGVVEYDPTASNDLAATTAVMVACMTVVVTEPDHPAQPQRIDKMWSLCNALTETAPDIVVRVARPLLRAEAIKRPHHRGDPSWECLRKLAPFLHTIGLI